ncbi:ABC transporter G family protein [Cavenderia fasciculata]|uniref:ABC transporter G family protein n=1 Tax=Cavenderia fasciculata TaxID=261658 RepID=F4Q030_CACFS|nr:ABC transporter G family protein [Cavenderia fasciculata]EGG18944.1 ABC transporter G family protein [Cavenderia fasciculata]|eukprot:XP_004357406.1 ABC transporter G family protein [Cavenderia fasciculata]
MIGGHYLFAMDNYYTSLQVATVLSNFGQNNNGITDSNSNNTNNNNINNNNNKIHYVMTVRAIRPSYLFKDGLGHMVQKDSKKKLAAIAFPKENSGIPQDICATAINDSKVTYFLSNACSPSLKDGKLTKLDVQTQYNATTHGVDLSGQLSSNCRSYPHRKTKYTHVNLMTQFDRAMVNAYCIFKKLQGRGSYRFCDFVKSVVQEMLRLPTPPIRTHQQQNIGIKIDQSLKDKIKQLEEELDAAQSGNGSQYYGPTAAAQTVVHALVRDSTSGHKPCQYCKVLKIKARTRTTKVCCQCKVNFHDECYLIAHLPENKVLLATLIMATPTTTPTTTTKSLSIKRGFFVNLKDLPSGWVWMPYISYFKYLIEAIVVNSFQGIVFSCSDSERIGGQCPTSTGEQVIDRMNYGYDNYWRNVWIVLLFVIAFRVLAFLVLSFKSRDQFTSKMKTFKPTTN